jgi:hypothetical protein
MVANPATEPSLPADTPVARPAVPVPDFRMQASGLCPGCGKTTQSQWLFCAYCEHPLRSPFGGRPDGSLRGETDAAANRKAVLAGLGGVVVVLSFVFALPALATSGDPRPLAVLVIGVVMLLGASTVIHLVRNKGEITGQSFRRIVLGSLTLVGALVTIGFVLSFAGAVFALVVCTAGGRC